MNTRNGSRSLKWLLSSASLLMAGSVAHAALVYSQNFESLSASANGTALNGQGGFSANSTVNVYNGGGVTYTGTGGLNVPGGNNTVSLNQASGATNANYAGTSFTAQSGANLFFSFTYNYNNANQATDTGADFFRLQFSNSTSATSNNYLGVQLQGGIGASPNVLMSRGRSDTNNPGVVTGTGVSITANGSVAYLVSGQLTWNGTAYDAITMWINPTSTASAPTLGQYLGTQSSSMTGSTLSTINSLVFQNGTTPDNLDAGDFMKIDNLKLGTSWSDVAAIPEPASVGLIAAGVLGVAALRRLRRRS